MNAVLEAIGQDLRYTIRTMRKNLAFAVTAVLTLTLGIGANTAMFTVIRTVLLKPLAYRDPDGLVRVSIQNRHQPNQDCCLTLIRFEEMKAAHSFTDLGAFFLIAEDLTISGAAGPEAMKVARVSANFLQILGVEPVLGRSFLAEEDTPGGPPVTMISAELWQRRFGGDPLIAGKTVSVDSTPYTIIGVLPAGFKFPFAGFDLWITKPADFTAIPPRAWPTTPVLIGFGRLRPHVSLDQARAELNVLSRQYALAHSGLRRSDPSADPATTIRVIEWKDSLVSNVRVMLWTLFGSVGFVLLIACANVASLLLARATGRSREFAIRAALGAPRGRLINQLLAESIFLASAGGVLGAVLARWVLAAIVRSSAFHLPRSSEIHLDTVVLAFTVALSIATGVLFGLFPALGASRPDLADALRASGEGANHGTVRDRPLGLTARGLLVVGQVALSMILLIGAGLLLESFARLEGVDPGFRAANILTLHMNLARSRYKIPRQRAAFINDLVRRIETLPGVLSVTATQALPMTVHYGARMQIEEQPSVPVADRPMGFLQSVTPGYFVTLGIPLRRGRDFTDHDGPEAPRVIVINEALAHHFWPAYPRGPDPIGQHMDFGGIDPSGKYHPLAIAIVGIVGDVHASGLAVEEKPEMYVPYAQNTPLTADMAIRINGDPRRFVHLVRAQVLALDREEAISDVQTMDDLVEKSVGERRLTMILLGSFAVIALLLAVVGIYGIITYSVAQRTKELAIRRALGARYVDILWLVLGQGLGLVLSGMAIGIGGALALTRLMTSLLFHVGPTDPMTFSIVVLTFLSAAIVAGYIPARRATRVDPMAALR